MVVDATEIIRYFEIEFMGYLNDAQTFALMRRIGRYFEIEFMGYLNDAQTFALMRRIGTELCFPEQCVYWAIKFTPLVIAL